MDGGDAVPHYFNNNQGQTIMAIDFDAIRKKLGQLSGQNKKSTIMWRPEEGKDYSVRIIALPNNDGQPFKDRWYYYGIGGDKAAAILAPYQFGKRDPIQELINKLREDNSDASRELAKKLYPKMRTYAAVVVRGEEDRGVRLWAFGKMIYQDLLKLMLDEDYGDITDPLEGRDVKVSVTKTPGKQYADTKVTPRGTTSPLSKDKDQIKTWLSSIPNIDDYEELTPVEEIEKRVNDWLGGGSESSSPEKEVGLTRGNKSDSIENDLAELRGNKPASAPVKKKTMDDLEDAFADLE
jgi:hypothetical protein